MSDNLVNYAIARGESVVAYWKRSMVYVEHREGKRRTIIAIEANPQRACGIASNFAEARKGKVVT